MDRLRVSTYVRTKKGDFVDVFSAEAGKRPKKAYLEGAIELVLEGKAVLDQKLWDDVEFLWWGLVDMVVEFRERGQASMDFPDQPLTARLTRREGEWLRFEVRTWQGQSVAASSVREAELFSLLTQEGRRTLVRLAELNPANADSHERALAQLAAWSA